MAEKMTPPAPKSAAHATGPSFDYKSVLQHMIQSNASDLHLKVGRPPTLRIDGHMMSMELPALKQEDLRSLAEQIMAPKNIKEFSEQKESDFALAVPGIGRFRVNAYQQRGTIAYAMRTVPFQAKTVAELNLPEVCERIALMPRGLILVTGITGSGKSTALASMLHYINQNRHAGHRSQGGRDRSPGFLDAAHDGRDPDDQSNPVLLSAAPADRSAVHGL